MFKKRSELVITFALISLLFVGFASASIFDWFNSITGKPTSNNFNLSVTLSNNAPSIVKVTVAANPNPTDDGIANIQFNFTAYDGDGFGNLKLSSAKANFTRGGEALRYTASCTQLNTFSVNYSNFSCVIGMMYYDQAGPWNITAYIEDNDNTVAQNLTHTFNYGSLASFMISPQALTFSGASPNSINKTATTSLLLNNTGNTGIAFNKTQINSTNLRGDSTNTSLAIWAANMSVGVSNGVTSCAETTMVRKSYVNVTNAQIPRGNHSANNGDETSAQEQLYFCIRYIGSELRTDQTYSTSNETEGAWIIRYVE